MDRTKTFGHLPLVASMLGNKLGVKVQTGTGDTACTDGETIFLPPLPLDEDEKMLGLVNGFIDHEAAHIRFTDFEAFKAAGLTPIGKFIWNAVEDWRIEHEQVKRYPGCRKHFQWLIKQFFMDEQKAEDSPVFSVLNYILLTLRSWDVPELAARCEEEAAVLTSHWPTLRKELDTILGDIPDQCHSTEDSIAFARRFLYLLEERAEDEMSVSQQSKVQAPAPDEGEQGQAEKSETRRERGRMKEEPAPTGESLLKKLMGTSEGDLPQSMDERLSSQLKTEANQVMTMRMAVAVPMKTKPLPEDVLKEAQEASRVLGVKLQALLQAQTFKRRSSGRCGVIDERNLYRLFVRDPRVFLRQEKVQGWDTAVHILLDSSFSMEKGMKLAASACYAVATALMRIPGLNVGITSFPSQSLSDLQPTVFPVLRHGERLRAMEIEASGMTPLAEALCWVATEMAALKERRKIILLITDGAPDSVPLAEKTVQHLQEMGFEIAGIGIQSQAIEQVVPSCEVISTITELAPALFRILHDKLVIKR